MPDDSKITRLHPRPREVRLDGLRGLSDGDTDALEALGMGRGIPHSQPSREVTVNALMELRDALESIAVAHHGLAKHIEAVAQRLADLIDDNDQTGGAA